MRTLLLPLAILPLIALPFACSASGERNETSNGAGASSGGAGGHGACDECLGVIYTPCDPGGTPGTPVTCPGACMPGKGCVDCFPGSLQCVGNEVRRCNMAGTGYDEVVEVCDAAAGQACGNGKCGGACDIAADQPSNVGCEFWAVDLDQQDGFNDPASAPWGVVALERRRGHGATSPSSINDAPVGQPALAEGRERRSTSRRAASMPAVLPTRELDCGVKPNDYASPGTCLSSNAYRITSSTPIVVYQFNVFENAFSNDASLLLPTTALGKHLPRHRLGRGASRGDPGLRHPRSLVRDHRRRQAQHGRHGQAELADQGQPAHRGDPAGRRDQGDARAVRRA